MTHRKTITLIALAALLPLTALAQPGQGRRGGGPGGPGGPGVHGGPGGQGGPGRHMFPPPGYLDLTDEQIEATQAIREVTRTELEGTRETGRALREQLQAALEGDAPDATEVGQLTLDLHALRQQTRAVLEDAESQFAALLTAEQLEKWENFKELRGNRRGPRHRERSREGRRGSFGGGFGEGSEQL